MSNPINPTEGKRLDQLQFLRFIAFFFVFSLHVSQWTQNWFNVTNLCLSSISFFFILSGFVSGYNASNRTIELTWESWKKSMLKRLKKIYPLYILTLAVSLYFYGGLSQALIYTDYGMIESLTRKFIKCALMLQSWYPINYFDIYPIAWFISTIIFLYAVSLPILYIGKKILGKENGTKLLAVTTVCVFSFTLCYCYFTKDLNTEYWQYVLPVSRLGEFTLGICLGLLFHPTSEYLSKSSANNPIIFTVAEVAVLIGYFVYANSITEFSCGTRIFSWIIPNLLLIAVFMNGKGYISKLFSTKPLLLLGNATLELYLVHILVIKGFLAYNGSLDISDYALTINFWMCLLVTTAVGLFIHKQTTK